MPDKTGRAGILSIGRIYCDLIFRGMDALPRLGEERFAREFSIMPGGGAYITAAHMAGLGLPAVLLARLGTDQLSGAIAPILAASAVDLSYVERSGDAGPQLTVAMIQGGERAFLSKRAGHAAPAGLAAALADPAMRHIHIAEFAMIAEIPALIDMARSAGLSVSLDPSWDDALIRDPGFVARCAGADVFLPNAAEARMIAGTDDLDRAGRWLAGHFPLVVIKDGSGGAQLFHGGGRLSLPTVPGGPVLDTTGAGDAFNAGFLTAWLAGRPVARALAEGIACGSLSVQAFGGAGRVLDPATVACVADVLLAEAGTRHG